MPPKAIPAAHDDAAVELALRLPAGADRCAVTRPGHLSATRRALLGLLGRGGPGAWLSRASVVAHAWAERSDDEGRTASIILLRANGDPTEVRKAVQDEIRVRVAWEGGRCPGPDCDAYRARFLDAHTLELERGPWPADASGGVTARCVTLARTHPNALEVSARRGQVLVRSLADLVPRRIESVLEQVPGGVRLVRKRWMSTEEWAERARVMDLTPGGPGDLSDIASEFSSERRGRLVVSTYHFEFEDLYLAAQDQRRLRQAEAAVARQSFLLPPDKVDPNDLRQVRRQVALRLAAMAQTAPPLRREHVQALRKVLDRAVAAHPEAFDLRRRYVRLLLDELGDPRRAETLADDALARGPDDPEQWKLLAREARAAQSEDLLREALVHDGVTSARDARRAAHDLVELRKDGVDYALAEGAMRVATVLGEGPAVKSPSLRPITPPVRFALSSVLPSLVALVDAGEPSTAGRAVYFAVRGRAVLDRSGPDSPCLVFHQAHGDRMCVVGLNGGIDARAITLGRALPQQLADGPVELVVATARDDAPAGLRPVLRVTGRVEGAQILIDHGPARLGGADWDRVRRYLAEPLDGLALRVFPPPELHIEADTSAHAEQIGRAAAADDSVRCQVDGRDVHCELPTPDSTGSAGRVLLRLVGPLLPVLDPAGRKPAR